MFFSRKAVLEASEAGVFGGALQQDAHEFLNYLLNRVSEVLVEGSPPEEAVRFRWFSRRFVKASGEERVSENRTWVHDIFESVLTNTVQCLTCETVSFVYASRHQLRPRAFWICR